MAYIHCWQYDGLSCGVVVDGEPKHTYELWLQHGQDVIRRKMHYTLEAAVAESKVWQAQMAAARTAATSQSTPY